MSLSAPSGSKNIPSLLNLDSIECKDLLLKILQSECKPRSKRVVSRSYKQTSDDDGDFTSDDDHDVDFVPQNSEDESSISDVEDLTEKAYSEKVNKKITPQEVNNNFKSVDCKSGKNLEDALLKTKNLLSELSKSTLRLQHELHFLRENPRIPAVGMKRNYAQSVEQRSGEFSHMIAFTTKEEKISIPINQREDITKFDQMLDNPAIYSKAFTHLKVIFGSIKQRDEVAAVKKLILALVSADCLSNVTWTGKSRTGKKIAFKDLEKFHRILIDLMKVTNERYCFDDFKYAMVNHVLKYAYIHGPGAKKRKVCTSNREELKDNIEVEVEISNV